MNNNLFDMPSVTNQDIATLVFYYVTPRLTEGDVLTSKNEKLALADIIRDGVTNPWLVKILSVILTDKRYGSLYAVRKAGTDYRGTFRSAKDKDGYLSASLLGVEGDESLEIGSFTFEATTVEVEVEVEATVEATVEA